jgi:SNF2 family DNA or RNA helicase
MPKDWKCDQGRITKPAPVAIHTEEKVHTGELFGHQVEAFEQFKDEDIGALLLEPGLGKTAIFLRLAGYKFKQGKINALLIISPNGVHAQTAKQQVPLWLDCPYNIQCLFGRGGQKVAYPFDPDPEFLQVVSVNVETFSTPKKWMEVVEWANSMRTMIVLDEATVIKSIKSQRTQRILYMFNTVVYYKKKIISSKVRSVARFIVTGTPVTNSGIDLWPLFEFLRPNFFNRNYYSFSNHYGMFSSLVVNDNIIKVPLSKDIWEAVKQIMSYGEANAIFGVTEDTFNVIHSQDKYEGPYKHAQELRKLIEPVSIFKRLEECVDMPKQTTITRELIMSDDIEKCYTDMQDELLAEYEGHTTTAKSKLTALIRLQQICSGFIVEKEPEEDEEPEDESNDDILARLFGIADDIDVLPSRVTWIGATNPKLDALYQDVEGCSKPLIIATRFTAEADRIYNDLSGKYKCCLMTGWKRIGTLEEFQEGKYEVMVANSAVINRGFNLQNSHVILIYSNTFSLENRVQLEGRVYRIGQTKPVEYIDYSYGEGTIDSKIVSVLQMKRSLLDYIMGNNLRDLIKW